MNLREIVWGCVDSTGSEYGLFAGCCECGDEHLGSGATELFSLLVVNKIKEQENTD
jgi:hypothetical protein